MQQDEIELAEREKKYQEKLKRSAEEEEAVESETKTEITVQQDLSQIQVEPEFVGEDVKPLEPSEFTAQAGDDVDDEEDDEEDDDDESVADPSKVGDSDDDEEEGDLDNSQELSESRLEDKAENEDEEEEETPKRRKLSKYALIAQRHVKVGKYKSRSGTFTVTEPVENQSNSQNSPTGKTIKKGKLPFLRITQKSHRKLY